VKILLARALRGLVLMAGLAAVPWAGAQPFPSKPITIIVPYPAGGVVDLFARTLGPHITEVTGQPVIVVNRAGANSIIGMTACARAPADGYTACMTIGDSLTYNPLLYADLPYTAADFAPVTILAWSTSMLVANANAPVGSFKEMVAYAKAKPGALNFGTWGPASTPDIYLRWIKRQFGIDITAIPYKGAGQANPALFAGEIDITLYGVGNALPHLKAGKLKPLAVMGTQRSSLLPDVPSLGEEGADPGLAIYFCLFAPAKTPKPIIDRLNAEFVKALHTPKAQAMLEQYTLRTEGNSSDDFARFMAEERVNATRVFNVLGIRPGAAPSE
jgi:tripartite-type tricarboxylate transporter receptor subunit TctC